MKIDYKKFIYLFLFCFIASTVFANTMNTSGNYTNQDSTINLTSQQKQFTITLPSNPTTGYSWMLKDYSQSLIMPVSHQILPPSSQLIGAGTSEVFVFQLNPNISNVPQVGEIKLLYARPWNVNDNPTVKVFALVYTPGK